MVKKHHIFFGAAFICTLIFTGTDAQVLDAKGMAAAWVTAGYSDQWATQLGGRYIPELDITLPVKNQITIEGELSAIMAGSYTSPAEEDNYYGRLKPYRMWMKVTGNQFEVRAGLQKINFGSATILRPLMWFDRIDPRDPLQLTDGVYGLLGRYYTLNNINFWAWGLYGNSNTKGWEQYVTKNRTVEYGGRLQFPLPRAEIGISFHSRKGLMPIPSLPVIPNDTITFNDRKLGIDIKADLGIGLWIEDVIGHKDQPVDYPYTNMLTVGADYTFGLGNGLHLMAENFIYQFSNNLLGNEESIMFSALSISYPISLTVNLSGILYYDWESKELYRFINAGLTYDRFSYYLMGFWNPQRFNIFDFDTGPSLFNGTGIQLMVVFNH